ncbi:MAG: hypothetical protein ABSF60_11315 [Verrucomicrobiota bacterium]|jgi:hypothetical protein
MNSSNDNQSLPPPLDLSGWRKLPAILMVAGAVLSLIGAVQAPAEFGFSWLLAFMFFLSIALGALFLVMVHHLSDAGWSVAIRRVCEHIAALLFPWLAILFLPVAFFAKHIYSWMTIAGPHTNNSLSAKLPVFTMRGFYITSAVFFGIWWLLSSRLLYWSLRQDETGDALCTRQMRYHSGWGIVAFALTLTFSGVLWMQAVQYQWFSAVYGVYLFASYAWAALAAVYIITVLLQRQRILDRVLHNNQFYFLGLLFFAFTIFQAYNEFAQYFVVWNANMPEETFWYLIRENGSWRWVGLLLVFGHFLLPFFVLLPVKAKSDFRIMLPVCVWALAMNFLDLAFNILPTPHPNGYPFQWLWLQLGCLAFMGGFLGRAFLKNFNRHAPFPQKDPRLLEAMGIHHPVADEIPGTAPTTGGQP